MLKNGTQCTSTYIHHVIIQRYQFADRALNPTFFLEKRLSDQLVPFGLQVFKGPGQGYAEGISFESASCFFY